MKEEIIFVDFRKEHGLELIQLWRKSFAKAMGMEEDTREEAVNEHLAYLPVSYTHLTLPTICSV